MNFKLEVWVSSPTLQSQPWTDFFFPEILKYYAANWASLLKTPVGSISTCSELAQVYLPFSTVSSIDPQTFNLRVS